MTLIWVNKFQVQSDSTHFNVNWRTKGQHYVKICNSYRFSLFTEEYEYYAPESNSKYSAIRKHS